MKKFPLSASPPDAITCPVTMNLLEDLTWRKLIADCTDIEGLGHLVPHEQPTHGRRDHAIDLQSGTQFQPQRVDESLTKPGRNARVLHARPC